MKISALTHCISLLARSFVQQADVRTQQTMQRWTTDVQAPAPGLRT